MADVTLHIPEPTGTFDVVIKDSVGTTVYSASHNNDPFTVSLSAGDYIVYTTLGTAENGWCLTVPACTTCPEFIAAVITLESGSYYFYLRVNLAAGFCPFDLFVESIYTSGTVTIGSLDDFTSNVGDVYTKKILIGGASSINYSVSNEGGLCFEGVVSYGCEGVPYWMLRPSQTISGVRYLVIRFTECAAEGGCNDVTINYTQVFPVGGTDSGSFPATVDCDALPYDVYIPLVATGDTGYNISVINCCGATVVQIPFAP